MRRNGTCGTIGKTIPTIKSKRLTTDISNHNKRRTKKITP
ncbi:hypothetical protein LRU_02214 [Ligilactobacillus ruminis SPM0211]|uniref:Uncharacterized protein n=1 Tax=Ligilactobacillus ruminis SPM0211 TaxID=1040964 RepID=F7R3F2_9LACO|nr:hypothetical protein LRU_02214 [Ligilactobacillus ruminis SPM0211]